MSESRAGLAWQALAALSEEMDRSDALDEATYTAVETLLLLMRAAEASTGSLGFERLDLLREALAAARATVVVTGYVLTTSADAQRRDSALGADLLQLRERSEVT